MEDFLNIAQSQLLEFSALSNKFVLEQVHCLSNSITEGVRCAPHGQPDTLPHLLAHPPIDIGREELVVGFEGSGAVSSPDESTSLLSFSLLVAVEKYLRVEA